MAVDESYFAKILRIEDPWTVTKVELDEHAGVSHVYVSTLRGKGFPCPVCRKECKVHDFYEREWRTLDLGSTKCIVHARVPRTECPEHGVKQINVVWAREYSRYTIDFEHKCMKLIREMPVNAAARFMRMSDDALWVILRHYVDEAMKNLDFQHVRRIGIDETSCKKGHDYITVFVDMDSGRILFATPGRDSGTVGAFVEWFESHGGSAEHITDVSCDMSQAFALGVSSNLKNAKITLDRFHVMQLATKTVDDVRRSVQNEKKIKLSIRFPLLRRRKDLRKRDLEELGPVLKENMLIASAYMLKEMLGDLYLLENEEYGKHYLEKWIRLASKGVHDKVKTLAKTISEHADGILRWFVSRLSNGILEGLNSVIQAVKRMARGYKRHENMITMTYIRGSGIIL